MGDISKVVDMLESGIPIDISDVSGCTALMNAAICNKTDVIRCLIEKGANVNQQDGAGSSPSLWTALHWASIKNHTEVIKILLQHGAWTDIKCSTYLTPIDYARKNNHKEAVDLLQQH